MHRNIEILDKYFKNCENCEACYAYDCIRKELVEGRKSTNNTAMFQLPELEEFVKEAKRFQKEGDTLGGVTLIDIIEHMHDFIVRQTICRLSGR